MRRSSPDDCIEGSISSRKREACTSDAPIGELVGLVRVDGNGGTHAAKEAKPGEEPKR